MVDVCVFLTEKRGIPLCFIYLREEKNFYRHFNRTPLCLDRKEKRAMMQTTKNYAKGGTGKSRGEERKTRKRWRRKHFSYSFFHTKRWRWRPKVTTLTPEALSCLRLTLLTQQPRHWEDRSAGHLPSTDETGCKQAEVWKKRKHKKRKRAKIIYYLLFAIFLGCSMCM